MAMSGKVLRMRHREKKSVREIVKATSLARNTVRKYLRIGKAEAPKYRRPDVLTKQQPGGAVPRVQGDGRSQALEGFGRAAIPQVLLRACHPGVRGVVHGQVALRRGVNDAAAPSSRAWA